MFSFIKTFVPEVKKWIFPHQNDQEFLEKFSVCDSETFHFELVDKSQIRSIHYLNNTTHFNPKLYEKFISSFKDNLPENQPQTKNNSENISSPDFKKYIEYTVEKDDTLIGIALKFDVNIQVLENINRISEGNIYPNQVIKIPKKEVSLSNNEEEEKKMSDTTDISNELSSNMSNEGHNNEILDFRTTKKSHSYDIFKIQFFYCTSYGQIPGIFTLNPYLLMFDPDYAETKNQVGDMRVIKFQACIDLADINEAFIVTLPSKYCESFTEDKIDFTKDFYLQIIVGDIGTENIEKSKHAARLFKLRQEKKGFGTLFFKLYEKNENGKEMKNQEKLEKIRDFLTKLQGNIELRKKEITMKQESQSSSTMIPFYDLFYDQIKQMIKEEKQALEKLDETNNDFSSALLNQTSHQTEIFRALPHYLPAMSDNSEIIDKDQFIQIINYLPSFVKLRNWKLTYANWKDGMSLNTNCQNIDENVLIVKDFDGYVYGGFCTNNWEINQNFYGTGETFLFTFKNEKRIKVFNWTSLNYDIMFASSDGLALGCGEKFGLYINKELLKGSSYPSETFRNEVLSKENDFEIQYLEIWSLDENLEG